MNRSISRVICTAYILVTLACTASPCRANPWHDVEVKGKAPGLYKAIIEIPEGSKNKYELDKRTGLLKLDRVLSSSMRYPASYGFFPRTLGGDGDPLDLLVLCQEPIVPLTLVTVRPLGHLKMSDQGEGDEKVIAVFVDDPVYGHYRALSELPPHMIREIRKFFEDYKALDNKKVTVHGIGEGEETIRLIEGYIRNYSEKKGTLIK